MRNEKYINYYIETLTSTLTECVVRNVSLQANARLSDEVIGELSKKVEELNSLYANRDSEIESLKIGNVSLESLKKEFESLKNQQSNSEVYRKELVKEREAHESTKKSMQKEIDNLKKQIQNLKTPPKKKNEKLEKQQLVSTDAVKDGGSF